MSSTGLIRAIVSYMDEAERPYQSEGEDKNFVLVTEISGDDGNWRVFFQIDDDVETHRVVIHAQLPVRIPDCNRLKVAELLTRINYELTIGNFELNLDDGEVLFKTTIDLADGQITQAMFERMYNINGQTTNEYYSQILSVGFGVVQPGNMASEEARPEGVMLQ